MLHPNVCVASNYCSTFCSLSSLPQSSSRAGPSRLGQGQAAVKIHLLEDLMLLHQSCESPCFLVHSMLLVVGPKTCLTMNCPQIQFVCFSCLTLSPCQTKHSAEFYLALSGVFRYKPACHQCRVPHGEASSKEMQWMLLDLSIHFLVTVNCQPVCIKVLYSRIWSQELAAICEQAARVCWSSM